MSSESENASTADIKDCCANCGIAEIDDVKLQPCPKCDLLSYCSDECQQDHRETHEDACKERAADLRDEILFKQPESTHLGDCPICCLPMPLDGDYLPFNCCSKVICYGCYYANMLREEETLLYGSCPFCRTPVLPTKENDFKKRKKKKLAKNHPLVLLEKRAEANDAFALRELGLLESKDGDEKRAIEYYKRAADLGNATAHFDLFRTHQNEAKGDEFLKGKALFHLEEAAIAGHLGARYILAIQEYIHMPIRIERGIKHFIIASNLGCDESLGMLKQGYKMGLVKKEDFAATLRAHQAAVNATKSEQRELAKEGLKDSIGAR